MYQIWPCSTPSTKMDFIFLFPYLKIAHLYQFSIDPIKYLYSKLPKLPCCLIAFQM
jgi:hypothetical protein